MTQEEKKFVEKVIETMTNAVVELREENEKLKNSDNREILNINGLDYPVSNTKEQAWDDMVLHGRTASWSVINFTKSSLNTETFDAYLGHFKERNNQIKTYCHNKLVSMWGDNYMERFNNNELELTSQDLTYLLPLIIL